MTPPFPCRPLDNAAPLLADPATLRGRARDLGYLYLPALLEPASVLALRRRVLILGRELGWLADDRARPRSRQPAYDDARFVELQARLAVLEEFQALGRAPRLRAVLETLSDGPVLAGWGALCRLLLPGGGPTPPHQDRFYVGGTGDLWTAWLPLGDCSLKRGPLALLPGSHRRGLLPHGGKPGASRAAGRFGVAVDPRLAWAAGALRCGDVLLFHGLTVHRSCPNRSRRGVRLSVDYRYRTDSSQW